MPGRCDNAPQSISLGGTAIDDDTTPRGLDASMTGRTDDGSIDFSRYSLAQVQELQFSIDERVSPRNAQNLRLELNRRQQSASESPAEHQPLSVRFTPSDGWTGWSEARLKRRALYGAGSLQVRTGEVILRGMRRTWLGAEEETEHQLPLSSIQVVHLDMDAVEFEAKPHWGLRRRYQLRTASPSEAAQLAAELQRAMTPSLRASSAQLQEFNRRLRAQTRHVWLTPSLVAVNGLVFLVMMLRLGRPGLLDVGQAIYWGSNYGPLTINGQWWRLLTALFVHGSWLHLLLNMWVLWNVGRLTERLYGPVLFLTLYLATGILSGLASIAWDPTHSSIGASGAIFGILGAFLAYLSKPQTRVPAAVVRTYWVPTILFVIFNLVDGALTIGIDNAAHVGGLFCGFCLGWLLAQPLDSARRLSIRQGFLAFVFTLVCVALVLGQSIGIGSQLTIPEQYFRAHPWYGKGEAGNLALWQQLAQEAASGTLSDTQLSQRLEHDIIPFWKDAYARLQRENQALAGPQRAFGDQLAEFAHLHLQWALAAEDATANHSASAISDSSRLQQETDLAQARMERIGMRASMEHRRRALANQPWILKVRRILALDRQKCIRVPEVMGGRLGPTDPKTDGPALRDAASCRAQHLFWEGDYKTLDSLMTQYTHDLADLPDGGSTLSGLTAGLRNLFEYGGLDIQQLLGRTADWRRAAPASYQPELIEAMVFESWAWSVRGHGFANDVTRQAWAVFAHRTEMAAAGLREIADRAAVSPLWYELSLDVGLDQSLGVDRLREIFDQGSPKFPGYYGLHRSMLRILMPRWGGSYGGVNQFIQAVSSEMPPARRAETYARLFWIYDALESGDANIFEDAQANWEYLEGGFYDLMRRYPKSNLPVNGLARLACVANDAAEFKNLQRQLQSRYSAAAWSAKVSLQSCEAKFANQKPSGGGSQTGVTWPAELPTKAGSREQRRLWDGLNRCREQEARALEVTAQLSQLRENKSITDVQWADRVTKEVLPLWDAADDAASDLLGDSEYQDSRVVQAVLAYVQGRKLGMELSAEAAKNQDASKAVWARQVLRESDTKAQAASTLLQESAPR